MFDCLRWGSSDAFGSAFLGLHVWELCFSLVSPLWESCYSLAFGWGMRPEGAVHLLRRTLCFSLYLLPPPFYTSPPLFSFLSSFFLHCFLICFFFFLSLSSVPIFFSSFLFLFILSFSFVSFFFFFFIFFLRELLVLSVFQDVNKDITDCNRM